MRALGFGLCVALALAGFGESARAEGPRPAPSRARFLHGRAHSKLPEAEQSALLAGDTVTRPMVFEKGDGRYVGGVAYQIVSATPNEVFAALANVNELPQLLPRTKNAKLIDVGSGGARVELTQGTSVVEATYTVHMRRAGSEELRFWLDASRPHGIRDVWGYVRAQPIGHGKSLVTVAVALDVGPGLVRMLFEERIQRVILGTPRQFRDYFEPRALARGN